MEKGILFKTITKNHSNRFVLAKVALRDAETDIAKSFLVLQSVRTTDEAKRALDFYESEGYSEVVVLPVFDNEDNPELQKFPPELTAKTFRILYHA